MQGLRERSTWPAPQRGAQLAISQLRINAGRAYLEGPIEFFRRRVMVVCVGRRGEIVNTCIVTIICNLVIVTQIPVSERIAPI